MLRQHRLCTWAMSNLRVPDPPDIEITPPGPTNLFVVDGDRFLWILVDQRKASWKSWNLQICTFLECKEQADYELVSGSLMEGSASFQWVEDWLVVTRCFDADHIALSRSAQKNCTSTTAQRDLQAIQLCTTLQLMHISHQRRTSRSLLHLSTYGSLSGHN